MRERFFPYEAICYLTASISVMYDKKAKCNGFQLLVVIFVVLRVLWRTEVRGSWTRYSPRQMPCP